MYTPIVVFVVASSAAPFFPALCFEVAQTAVESATLVAPAAATEFGNAYGVAAAQDAAYGKAWGVTGVLVGLLTLAGLIVAEDRGPCLPFGGYGRPVLAVSGGIALAAGITTL